MREMVFYYAEPFNRGDFMVDYLIDGKVVHTEKVQDRTYSLDDVC